MPIERVSLINSNDTVLNNDFDYTKFEMYLTGGTSGVLFTNFTTKPEFALSGTSNPVISAGSAIIVCTRTTNVPIANQKIALRFELGSSKSFTGAVNGSKIFIEINQSLINDPTLIEDTYPSTDYALGLGIGTITMSTSYPSTNTYIPLWTYNGSTWSDSRSFPTIRGLTVDLSSITGNITTSGTVTAARVRSSYSATENNDVINKQYLDTTLTNIGNNIPEATEISKGVVEYCDLNEFIAGKITNRVASVKTISKYLFPIAGIGTTITVGTISGTKTAVGGTVQKMASIRIGVDGRYSYTFDYVRTSGSGTDCNIIVKKNGTTDISSSVTLISASGNTQIDITSDCNENDTIDLFVTSSVTSSGTFTISNINLKCNAIARPMTWTSGFYNGTIL